jgi:hypothetical protein
MRKTLICFSAALVVAIGCTPPLVPPTQSEIDVAKATIARLTPNFDRGTDGFTQVTTIIHKNNAKQATEQVTNIDSHISMTPSLLLLNVRTNHYRDLRSSPGLLTHNRFSVLVAGRTITTMPMLGYRKISDQIFRNIGPGMIYESVVPHVVTSEANDVLRFIASCPSGTVNVRLYSGNPLSNEIYDFTLDKSSQEAICQTLELYDALMVIWRSEGKRPPDSFKIPRR